MKSDVPRPCALVIVWPPSRKLRYKVDAAGRMRIVATALVRYRLDPPSAPVRLVEAEHVLRVDEHLWTAAGTGTHAIATGRSCSIVIYTQKTTARARG